MMHHEELQEHVGILLLKIQVFPLPWVILKSQMVNLEHYFPDSLSELIDGQSAASL